MEDYTKIQSERFSLDKTESYLTDDEKLRKRLKIINVQLDWLTKIKSTLEQQLKENEES